MNIWCYVVLLITIALRSTCHLTDSTPRTEWRSGRNSAVHLNTVNNQVSGAKRPLQITLSVHRQGRRRPLAHWLTDRCGRPQDQGNDELVNKKKSIKKIPNEFNMRRKRENSVCFAFEYIKSVMSSLLNEGILWTAKASGKSVGAVFLWTKSYIGDVSK